MQQADKQDVIFITNLDYSTSVNDVFSLFVRAGPISNCFLLYDSSRRPTGRAIVQYTADNAYSNLLNMNLILDGHTLRIEPISQSKLWDITQAENYQPIEQYFPHVQSDELYTQYFVEQSYSHVDKNDLGPMKGIDIVRSLLKFKNTSNSESSKDQLNHSNNSEHQSQSIPVNNSESSNPFSMRRYQSTPLPRNSMDTFDRPQISPSRRIDYDRSPHDPPNREISYLETDSRDRDRYRERTSRDNGRPYEHDYNQYRNSRSESNYRPYSNPQMNYTPDIYHMNSNQYPMNQQRYDMDMPRYNGTYPSRMQDNRPISRNQSAQMPRMDYDPPYRSDMRDRDRRIRRDPRDRDNDWERNREKDRDYYYRSGY